MKPYYEHAGITIKLTVEQDAPATEAPASQPDWVATWKCRTCGCLWREWRDHSASLFDLDQKSCGVCELQPLPAVCDQMKPADPEQEASEPKGERVVLMRTPWHREWMVVMDKPESLTADSFVAAGDDYALAVITHKLAVEPAKPAVAEWRRVGE